MVSKFLICDITLKIDLKKFELETVIELYIYLVKPIPFTAQEGKNAFSDGNAHIVCSVKQRLS